MLEQPCNSFNGSERANGGYHEPNHSICAVAGTASNNLLQNLVVKTLSLATLGIPFSSTDLRSSTSGKNATTNQMTAIRE